MGGQNSKRSQFSGISNESKHHSSRKRFFNCFNVYFCLSVFAYIFYQPGLLLNMLFSGSKPVSHHNDYRPDPTGVRGGIPPGGVGGVGAADRIRAEHNGRNGNGLQQRTGNAASATPVAASNSPAHLSAALAAAAGAPAGTLILFDMSQGKTPWKLERPRGLFTVYSL